MPLRLPENREPLEIMILDPDPVNRMALRDHVTRSGEVDYSFSLPDSPRRARECLVRTQHDLVFLDAQYLDLFGEATDSETLRSTPVVMMTDLPGARPELDSPAISIDAILPKGTLNDEIVREILQDVFIQGGTTSRPYRNYQSRFHSRNFLKNYLNSILSFYGNTDIRWLLLMLQTPSDVREQDRDSLKFPRSFFRSVAGELAIDEIIESKLGHYGPDVYWSLHATNAIPKDFIRTVGVHLMDHFREVSSTSRTDGKHPNVVLQRINPGDVNLNDLFEELDRTLHRATITPGPSVINHG